MKANLQDIRSRMPTVLDGLENTLYATAKEVRALRTTCSEEYAEAILDQNGFGGDTAEIYFYSFAPEGFPSPSNGEEFQALRANPHRNEAYEKACYQGWKTEIEAVNGIVTSHEGTIEVNDYRLADYLREAEESGKTPVHRVQVKISMPGHENLRQLRDIVEE